MMKQVLMLLYAVFILGTAFSQSIEPRKPVPIVPRAIFQPKEITVEDPQYGLPYPVIKGQFAQAINIPVLPEPEFVIPELQIPIPDTDIVFPPRKMDTTLVTEATLGAGSQNLIYGSIMLSKFGARPNFSLQFTHETFDGTFLQPELPFFHHRREHLQGDLNLTFGTIGVTYKGHFIETETGLQNNSPRFTSRITRDLYNRIEGTIDIHPLFAITIKPEVDITSILNRGTNQEQYTGLSTGVEMTGELHLDNFKAGIISSYSHRNLFTNVTQSFTYPSHIVDAGVFARWIISPLVWVDSKVRWSYSDTGGHLFPFHLSVTAKPLPFFSVTGQGGYRITPYPISKLFELYDFITIPTSIRDNRGWFADIDMRFSLWKGASLHIGTQSMWNAYFAAPGALDQTTGFFTVAQYNTWTLEPRVRFSWDIFDWMNITASWNGIFPTDGAFTPFNTIFLDINLASNTLHLGGGLESQFETGPNQKVQIPILDAVFFYRFQQNIKLSIEASDILFLFLTTKQRYSYEPYENTGFRVTLKMQINF